MSRRLLGLALGLVLVLVCVGDAHADRRHGGHAYGHAPFDRGARDWWRGGHWHHGFHGGRDGWWWVIGAERYLFMAPVYPYPPQIVVVPPPPPPPPQVTVAPPPQPYCREYQGEAIINGTTQRYYGTACLQPDGSWRIMN